MDFDLIVRVYPFYLQAAWVTVQISALSIALGLTCGAMGTAARLSRSSVLRFIGATYVSVIRGTPALIQIFILYFGGPQIGLNFDAFTAGTIALGVNIGAYITETMRGAIIAVDRGQTEAARTLGLSRAQTMRSVILPQAARLMIRPLGVNINAQIKGTALVAAISVVELTHTAQRYIGSTYKPFEMFILAGAFYLVLIQLVGVAIGYLDRRAVLK